MSFHFIFSGLGVDPEGKDPRAWRKPALPLPHLPILGLNYYSKMLHGRRVEGLQGELKSRIMSMQ